MLLEVGPLTARPGQKVRDSVLAEPGVAIPVALVNGTRPGPRTVITAGVHGGEFTGVEAATLLAAELDPAEVRGQLVICPVANPAAVYQGRLGVSPVDGVNLNRVFPGDPDGKPTERLAAWLFANLVSGADAYIDLHSGGIDEQLRDFVGCRISGDAAVDARALELARSAGIPDVILGADAEGGNSHAAAARRGIPAILIEKGQLGERDLAAARCLADALRDRLLPAVWQRGSSPRDPGEVREWVWAGAAEAPVSGLWYPAFNVGDEVERGQPLGRIVDPADGAATGIPAPATGRLFYGMRGLTVGVGAELAAIAAPRRLGAAAQNLASAEADEHRSFAPHEKPGATR